MLRGSLRSAKTLGSSPIATAYKRQWRAAALPSVSQPSVRWLADRSDASKPPILPPSETRTSERRAPSASSTDQQTARTLPSANDAGHNTGNVTTTIDDVCESSVTYGSNSPRGGSRPQPPASLDDVGESKVLQDQLASSITPPPTSTPPQVPHQKSFFRRVRNAFLTMVLLSLLGFGGGVWYSRVNDNFHDFFTEYVPFGEQAVLYLEELDFRKRFRHMTGGNSNSRHDEKRVKIPAQSGASWRVADSGESAGRHFDAYSSKSSHSSAPPRKQQEEDHEPKAKSESSQGSSPIPSKAETTSASRDTAEPATVNVEESGPKQPQEFKAPEVNEPSRFPPIDRIDLMTVPNADELVVRDLVYMLNDLITVINADQAQGKYGATIDKAKNEIMRIGGKLRNLITENEKKAASVVKTSIKDFEKGATELIQRVENTMRSQEADWRREFEQEMKSVRESYEERVKRLVEREQKLNEEKLSRELLEQSLALKKEFVGEVKGQVEQERLGRLTKLKELSSAVADLENLTTGWNDIIDSNHKTQQLHVAVDAVRASLADAHHPRPFIKELVALKEIATDDAVVDAAIASITPTTYQRGISPPAQLIDRFRKVADEVRKASLLPEDAGVASHISSRALSHLLFKKQGLAEGSDVESILTRAQTFLEEGDLDGAAREMNGLQGWAKTLSRDWLSEVRKVLEVQQALDVISTEARLQSLRIE